ncbi:MAG: FkbM family methyltransferase [Candidatus Micrarchaeota archaeon]|nr:FkbM family methyltransferase [Candidatus Micrarchaeota archaeon]
MTKNITLFDNVAAYALPFRDLLNFRSVVVNWYDIGFFRSGVKKHVVLRLKSGKTYSISNLSDYSAFYRSPQFQMEWQQAKGVSPNLKIGKHLQFSYKGKRLRFVYTKGDKANILPSLMEQFLGDEYSYLDVKNKVVVDIGASIGDTAIYFAVNGAKQVYAFELFKYPYQNAKENIALNKLSSKITLLNEGAGYDGIARVNNSLTNTVASSINSKGKDSVKTNSLKSIVTRFNIKHGVLKIDCEGCEYPIVLGAEKETLQIFDRIVIEYHYGYLDLEEKLRECGFEVTHTAPKFMFDPSGGGENMIMGLLFAKK